MIILFVSLALVQTLVVGDSTRVEFKLTKLENPEGIIFNGKKCDTIGKCDPFATGFIDTETPLNSWPGSKPIKNWTKIFEVEDVDSTPVGKIVSRDVCVGSAFNKGNLRVDVQDKDTFGSEQIDQFECMSGRDVRIREGAATWSAEKPCTSKFNPNKVKLYYSWRAFNVPDRDCGRPVSSLTPKVPG